MNQASPQTVLYMALELSDKTWRLAFSDTRKVRQTSVAAGDRAQAETAIEQAKQRLGLPATAPVVSCYEAGRDGFWIDRWLRSRAVNNVVVDSASLEVNRRARRVKTDRLDAEQLVAMLIRYHGHGERRLWRVVRVPRVADEDQRRWNRERERLLKEQGAHRARIKSLLVTQGIRVKSVARCQLPQLRDWQGAALAAGLLAELEREQARLTLVGQQLRELERQQAASLEQPVSVADQQAVRLLQLRGVGPISAAVLTREFFGWRGLKTRREVGALAGLTGTAYASGSSAREQGISKAGNRRVRVMMIELAWAWLRLQPDSQLTRWFWERFGRGSGRQRRVGIVAVARRLLVALWRYVEAGQVPPGAVLKEA